MKIYSVCRLPGGNFGIVEKPYKAPSWVVATTHYCEMKAAQRVADAMNLQEDVECGRVDVTESELARQDRERLEKLSSSAATNGA